MATLVLCEHDNQELKPSTLNTISAAQKLEQPIHLLCVGKGHNSVVDSAKTIDGVEKVLVSDNDAFSHPLAESVSELLQSVAGDYKYIMAPATTFGKNILPRLSGLLDITMVSDITEVIDGQTFVRPIYAGNAMATFKVSDEKVLITVRTTAFDAATLGSGHADVVTIDFTGSNSLSSFHKAELSESDRPELTSAKIIISGGRGMQSGDNFHLIESIADKLGAAVGASRAAVDAGFVPNDYQVGQTGKVVAPDLYIAVGISGAIQHLAGMKDSKVIVAINKDEDAPIFQVADYGLVADLFDVLPVLSDELTKRNIAKG